MKTFTQFINENKWTLPPKGEYKGEAALTANIKGDTWHMTSGSKRVEHEGKGYVFHKNGKEAFVAGSKGHGYKMIKQHYSKGSK